jgi:hypothetical protein
MLNTTIAIMLRLGILSYVPLLVAEHACGHPLTLVD